MKKTCYWLGIVFLCLRYDMSKDMRPDLRGQKNKTKKRGIQAKWKENLNKKKREQHDEEEKVNLRISYTMLSSHSSIHSLLDGS